MRHGDCNLASVTRCSAIAMASMARLDAFARGAVCALRVEGKKREDIVKKVRKKDGKRPSLRAVDAALAKHHADPWCAVYGLGSDLMCFARHRRRRSEA